MPWSTLPSSLQVTGRPTAWEIWPGGLRGGLGGDDEGSKKESMGQERDLKEPGKDVKSQTSNTEPDRNDLADTSAQVDNI